MKACVNFRAFESARYLGFVLVCGFIATFSSGCTSFRQARTRESQINSERFPTGTNSIQRISYQTELPQPTRDGQNQPPPFLEREMVAMDDPSIANLGKQSSFAGGIRPNRTIEQVPLLERLAKDQWRFYSIENAIPMALVFGTGAAFANTQLDSQIQSHFRTSVLGASSDEWFEKLHASKELGDGIYTLPIFGAAWLAKEWIDGPPALETFGNWGERSMRGFLVGAGPVIAGQYLTGGSRPSELEKSSHWHPLQDNNGVSGHAFMSSLPFITAAKMTDNPLAKLAFYSGSTIGPLSRMNDNAHYPSQIGIGWCLAYLSATAIDRSNSNRSGWSLKPLTTNSGSGLAAEYTW
jgi:hypothetical protein